MKLYTVDCRNIESESGFWEAYLRVVQPDGAEYFGCNLSAFWDALSAGGPGFPETETGCKIHFTNMAGIKPLRGGAFYSGLKRIESDINAKNYSTIQLEIE